MMIYRDDEVQPLEGTARDIAQFEAELAIGFRDIDRRRIEGHKYGSPLEASFAMWFYEQQRIGGEPEPFTLNAQVEVGRYRIDFQVVAHVGSESYPLKLAIEVDGHGWHERTREQVQTRDARDRELQMAGWTVFHFSYSEFTNDPSRVFGIVFRTAAVMRLDLLREP